MPFVNKGRREEEHAAHQDKDARKTYTYQPSYLSNRTMNLTNPILMALRAKNNKQAKPLNHT